MLLHFKGFCKGFLQILCFAQFQERIEGVFKQNDENKKTNAYNIDKTRGVLEEKRTSTPRAKKNRGFTPSVHPDG